MITILKLAGLSAVLSAGVVGAYEAPKAVASAQTKLYYDRIAPEAPAAIQLTENVVPAPQKAVANDANPSCGAWPYVATDCATSRDGTALRKVVRTITIERRDEPNTSTLVRLPAGR